MRRAVQGEGGSQRQRSSQAGRRGLSRVACSETGSGLRDPGVKGGTPAKVTMASSWGSAFLAGPGASSRGSTPYGLDQRNPFMQYGECVKGSRQRSRAGGSGWRWWPEVEEGSWPGGAGASAWVEGKAEEMQDGRLGQDCRKAFSVRTDAFSDTKMAIKSNQNDPDG